VLSGLELRAWQPSGFVQTGQKINIQPNVQVPVQNCIILQYFVKHTMHRVKVYQIIFPTHLVPRHLNILVGVMIKRLKTTQKTRRRAGTEDHFENA
jgi:hypothetical protein